MSEAKFTPGPWKWDDTVWNYDPEQQSPWLVDENDDWVLRGGIKCNEANARLIAAAPELLEACKAFADYISGPTSWTQDQEDALVTSVHSAIAKATGA